LQLAAGAVAAAVVLPASLITLRCCNSSYNQGGAGGTKARDKALAGNCGA